LSLGGFTARKHQHVVTLSLAERQPLLALRKKGGAQARTLRRANILLGADEGRPDALSADPVPVSSPTVRNIRQRVANAGLEAALHERPRPGAARKLEANHAAFLLALACSAPPDGRETWTRPLLADRLVA
jgi:Homeodomain-like domain